MMMHSNLLKTTMFRTMARARTSSRLAAAITTACTNSTGRRGAPSLMMHPTTRTTASHGVRSMATATRTTAPTTGGAQLSALAAENPYRDVLHYQHKNRTWSVQHVDYYTTALAIGFLEQGFQPGDVVLSWLPNHFSEQVR